MDGSAVMSFYHPTDTTYNLARAAYENVREKQGWPDWDDPKAAKYRELMLHAAREQRGEVQPRPRRLLVRLYSAARAAIQEFRR
jgi:hypothetical protein